MTAVGLVGLLFAGGVTAYATGLVHEYRPPRLTAADYVGTWHDTFGGEIPFSADGTFTAKRIRDYPFEASDLTDHYAGHSGGDLALHGGADGLGPAGQPPVRR